MLMFGREARLPVDICFQTYVDGKEEVKYQQYVENLKRDLQNAYQLASEASQRNHDQNKKYFDKRVKQHTLEEGDSKESWTAGKTLITRQMEFITIHCGEEITRSTCIPTATCKRHRSYKNTPQRPPITLRRVCEVTYFGREEAYPSSPCH